MKRLKQALSLGMAGVMMTAAPVTAFAASPEFSRSAEEWARLQDNKIEYDEIADLIHEYNATVQKNAIDLSKSVRITAKAMMNGPTATGNWQTIWKPA